MRSRWLTIAFCCLAAPAFAGEAEVDAIRAVLGPGPFDPAAFSAEFLAAVPPAQLEQVLSDVEASIGPVTGVTPHGGMRYLVETGTHELPVEIALDAEGRIATLFFRAPIARGGTLAERLAALEGLAPQLAYVLTRDGAVLHAQDPDAPLAAGSAFKLGVLAALRDEIEAGTLRWEDVTRLRAEDRSLPTGTLQAWPDGSPVTLHTLAALMVSISDNTATDALIQVLGRDRVETELGLSPLLTTREFFTLKADPALADRYAAADEAGRRQVLAELRNLPLPEAARVVTPHDAGVEWYVSPAALCGLMERVADLALTGINPGPANPAEWRSVSFKGGSEIGVLNLTTHMVAEDGGRYCFSATWNATAAIDELSATAAYAGVLAQLARSGG